MKTNTRVRVFLAGDVFGSSGISCVTSLLPDFIKNKKIDFVLANAENASSGTGINTEDAEQLFAAGVDVLTGGNHSFENRENWDLLQNNERVLRPANYPQLNPEGCNDFAIETLPGHGAVLIEKNGLVFAVLNIQGRENMGAIDCPFRCADTYINKWCKPEHENQTPIILVDFHAESTMEKEAMALYLDGRVSVVAGTHTHVQTADERILPKGTAYITDLGMTGPSNSVIGVDPALAIKRNITQVLYRMEESKNKSFLQGLIVDIDTQSRCAVSVERISVSTS